MNNRIKQNRSAALRGAANLAAFTGVALLASCAADNPWGNGSEGSGTMKLTLTPTEEVESRIPQFRATEQPSELTAPDANDFKIDMEGVNGTGKNHWDSLKDFNNAKGFQAGHYYVTASYGDFDNDWTPTSNGFAGRNGFSPAFIGKSEEINIENGKNTEVSIEAALAHSMVSITYVGFEGHYEDWHAEVSNNDHGEPLIFDKEETESGFVIPGELTINLYLKREEGKEAKMQLATEFPAVARTKYNMTFTLQEGTGQIISLTFDDGLEEETKEIELTDEIFTTPVPTVTAVGFTNGDTVQHDDWSTVGTTYAFDATAYTGFKSAMLKIETDDAPGAAWAGENDLLDENVRKTLKSIGIDARGFDAAPSGADNKSMGYVDVSQMCKLLTGSYALTLNVTDNLGRVAEAGNVILSNEPVTAKISESGNEVAFGSTEATLYVSYNGEDPQNEIKFTTDQGECTVLGIEEVPVTRSVATRTYKCRVQLPGKIYNDKINITPVIKGVPQTPCEIAVALPHYEIETDAFATWVKVRVTSDDDAELAEHIQVQINGTILTGLKNGEIYNVAGLTPGQPYYVKKSFDGKEWDNHDQFTTEAAAEIPNGNFNNIVKDSINSGSNLLQVGGQYNVSSNYTLKSSFKLDAPTDWATLNSLTAYSGSTNWNTWFVVPSTWVENGQAIIRSVGYNHAGTTPAKSGGAFNTKYYCENAPSANQLNNVAGELFLGEYSYTGTESRSNGIAFASRPSKFTFDYEYTAVNSEDKGVAEIHLYDATGNALISKTEELTQSGTITVDCSYQFGTSASKLYISFRSSNQAKAPINIPNGSALDEGQSLGNHNLSANSYHAVATGSKLIIDNVTAHYDLMGSASGAAKRRTTTKAKK